MVRLLCVSVSMSMSVSLSTSRSVPKTGHCSQHVLRGVGNVGGGGVAAEGDAESAETVRLRHLE